MDKLEIVTPPGAKYVLWSWSALEDAARMKTLDRKPIQRLLHVERHLRSAAIWLRVALEERFGSFAAVPDQDLMSFLTVVRNASAHPSAVPSNANPTQVDMEWEKGRGLVKARVQMTFDLEESAGSNAALLAGAKRYLARHDGDVFRALHAGVRASATWVNVPLDEEFEKLGKTPVGHETIRQPVRNRREYDEVVRALRSGREFNLGGISDELPDEPA